MKVSAAAKEYLIEIEVRKFTPKTIRSYRNNLNLFLRFCEEEAGIAEIENVSIAVVRQFSRFMSERRRKGTYLDKELVSEAQNIYASLNADEQKLVRNSDILAEAIAAIDSLAFDELENNVNIALMKGIIDGSFFNMECNQ